MQKIFTPILVIVVALLLFGFIRSSTQSVAAPEYTQTFNSVATASTSNATVTLYNALYNADPGSVVSITSNNTADTPAALAYTLASKALVVDGLNANDTRQLVIVYGWQQLENWTFMGTAATALPYVIVGVAICGGLFALYKGLFKGR
jgi:hypothetical protein